MRCIFLSVPGATYYQIITGRDKNTSEFLYQEISIFSTMNCSPNTEGQVGKSPQGCYHDYENSGTRERLKWKHFSCPLGISHLATNLAQLQSLSLQSSKQGVDEVNLVGMLWLIVFWMTRKKGNIKKGYNVSCFQMSQLITAILLFIWSYIKELVHPILSRTCKWLLLQLHFNSEKKKKKSLSIYLPLNK